MSEFRATFAADVNGEPGVPAQLQMIVRGDGTVEIYVDREPEDDGPAVVHFRLDDVQRMRLRATLATSMTRVESL